MYLMRHVCFVPARCQLHTTGNRDFAVCHRHSAKTKKHSAKALPSVTLGKQHTAYTELANSYLPSVFYRAFGKWFAECQI